MLCCCFVNNNNYVNKLARLRKDHTRESSGVGKIGQKI